jgi:transposase-like protein
MTINMADPAVEHDGVMAKQPRLDRPRRRSFSPAEKLRLLAGYEVAMESGGGNAFLRENGLYSSLMSEWRRTRDAGLLRDKPAGAVVGRTGPSSPRTAQEHPAPVTDLTTHRLLRTRVLGGVINEYRYAA